MLTLPEEVALATFALSLVLFVASVVGVPMFLVRIPDDYFVKPRSPRSRLRRLLSLFVGVTFIAMGIAMLVLPGQGILTIVVGLGILELPLRDRVVARILSHPKVKAAVDTLRRRAGKGSLLVPPVGPC